MIKQNDTDTKKNASQDADSFGTNMCLLQLIGPI